MSCRHVLVHPGLLVQGVEWWSRLSASLPGVELAVAVLPGRVCVALWSACAGWGSPVQLCLVR